MNGRSEIDSAARLNPMEYNMLEARFSDSNPLRTEYMPQKHLLEQFRDDYRKGNLTVNTRKLMMTKSQQEDFFLLDQNAKLEKKELPLTSIEDLFLRIEVESICFFLQDFCGQNQLRRILSYEIRVQGNLRHN